MTTEQVSEYSHEDTPYKLAKKNENLDPELVFYKYKKFFYYNLYWRILQNIPFALVTIAYLVILF